jgi:hypothetical protein
MKLPNGEVAIVEIAKIRDYCLSQRHSRGKHKARVFLAVLGISAEDAEEFRAVLLRAAIEGNAALGASDPYGTLYIIDFEMKRGEGSAMIRSSWIIRSGEAVPRFVTCFVL